MLSRSCAAWLVLLIVLPFSAPFSTCDLQTLIGNVHSQDAADPGSPLDPEISLEHFTSRHALPSTRITRNDLCAAVSAHPVSPVLEIAAHVSIDLTPRTLVGSLFISPLRL